MRSVCRWGGIAAMALLSGSALASDDLGALFDVSAWTEQSLELPATGSGAFDVTVNIGGVDHTFVLEPWSFRAPTARALEVGADGVRREVALAPARTYRGVSVTDPTVEAAGTLLDKGLTLSIIDKGETNADDVVWAVQPINDALAGVPRTEHIVYAASDNHAEGLCGGAIDTGVRIDGGTPSGEMASNAVEIAFDADFEFYGKNGSNTQQTIDDIDTVMAGVIIAYERDVDATFISTDYIVRTAEPDPYSSTNSSTLLNQFTNHWNSSQGGIHRDIAHLFTGKNIDSSVIGIAWLSSICTSNGYGVSESRFTLSINSRIALTAHEIGHNASANHCSGTSCFIMCAGLGGCGGIGNPPKFGQSSINVITPYIASRSCVDPPPPTFDDVPLTDLQVVTGNLLGGDLSLLDDSDNGYVAVQATPNGTGVKHLTRIDVLGDSPDTDPDTGFVEVELVWIGSAGKTRISAFDYDADRFVTLGNIATAPTVDTTYHFTLTTPGRFVDTDGTMEVQVRTQSNNNAGGYTLLVDRVDIILNGGNAVWCEADWDFSGDVNSADFFAFLADYQAGQSGQDPDFRDADLAAPFGTVNTADFFAFLAAYQNGC